MLRFLGQRDRSRKAVLVFLVAILAIGLVVAFQPWSGSAPAAAADDVAIDVAGYEITVRDLQNALQAYGQQLSMGQGRTVAQPAEQVYAIAGPQVIDGLIREKVIQYEADRLNIAVTDGEVQARLRQLFMPWPGPEQYRQRLQQAGLTPVEFEKNVRTMIASDKLRSFVSAALQVSPQEVEEDYRKSATTYTVRWVEVNPDSLRDKVAVNDADLRAFFEQKKGDFRINVEQRRARYIFIDQNKAATTVQPSEDELRAMFDPERGVREVRVSQIVLNVPPEPKTETPAGETPPETEESKIKRLADDIVKRARSEDGTPAEDFAQLAREYSQDAASRAKGGDLGFVRKSDKRAPDDALNLVFTMQENAVSQPIRKGDKFYIFKVTERKLPTFEESREQLVKESQVMKGYSRTVELATAAEEQLKSGKSADEVAAEINRQAGAEVAVVKETPFFAESDSVPDLGAPGEFNRLVFTLANPGDVAERVNVNNGFAVAQLIEKREPHDATFEEVKARVEDAYRTEKARELAAERARQLASQASTPDALKAAAGRIGLRPEERSSISGNDSIGPLVSDANRDVVYKLNAGQVSEAIKVDGADTYVVAAMVERKDADMGAEFEKQKRQIEERLLNAKRDAFFTSYIAAAQQRLKDEGKIRIYQEVIDAAVGPRAPVDPTMPMPVSGAPPRRTAPQPAQ